LAVIFCVSFCVTISFQRYFICWVSVRRFL